MDNLKISDMTYADLDSILDRLSEDFDDFWRKRNFKRRAGK